MFIQFEVRDTIRGYQEAASIMYNSKIRITLENAIRIVFGELYLDASFSHKYVIGSRINTCVHPKSLTSLSDKQLSTINPRASFVILRHHDRSKLNNSLELLASDKAVFGPTCYPLNLDYELHLDKCMYTFTVYDCDLNHTIMGFFSGGSRIIY